MFTVNVKMYNALKSLIANYFFVILNGLSIRIIAMLAILILSYHLGKEDFSKFAYIYNISMISAGMLFAPLITFYVRNSKDLGFYIYGKVNNFLICILLFFLLFLAALAFNFDSVVSFLIFLVFIFFYYIQQFITIHTSHIDKEMLGTAINILLMPFMWFFAYLFISIDIVESISLFFLLVTAMLLIRRFYNFVATPETKIDRAHGVHGDAYPKLLTSLKADFLPLLTTSVISGIGFLVYFFIVNKLFSSYSAEEKSIFNIVYQWFQIVIFFAVAINSKFLLNLRYSEKKHRDGCIITVSLLFIYFIILILFYNLSDLYSVQNRNMLIHHGFVMITTSLLSAVSSILGVYLVYYGKARKGIYFNVAWLIILFSSFFIFLSFLTVSESSVYSLFFSYLLHMSFLFYYVRKIAK